MKLMMEIAQRLIITTTFTSLSDSNAVIVQLCAYEFAIFELFYACLCFFYRAESSEDIFIFGNTFLGKVPKFLWSFLLLFFFFWEI